MRTLSAKIAKHWLIVLCLILWAICLTAASVVAASHAPLWRTAIFLAGILIGMVTAGLVFLFTLSLGMIRSKK